MKNIRVVDVKKSRFGKCRLTFRGPRYEGDTNTFVFCDKDRFGYIRIWYYKSIRSWACEYYNSFKGGYMSYGTEMLVGRRFDTARSAWQFISKEYWE